MNRVLTRSLVIAAAIVGGWSLMGAFFVSQDLVLTMLRRNAPLYEIAYLGTMSVIVWMLLTPFVLYFGQGSASVPRLIVRVVAITLIFSLLRTILSVLILPWTDLRPIVREDWGQVLLVSFHSNVTLILLVLGMRILYDSVRTMREKERRALTLEAQLARAQLEHLRFQLQPHFLFNTINGIATLVHTSPHRADEMLMDLAALLRSTLDLSRSHTIPLHRELELLDHYVRIQQMRFHDRLKVSRKVDTAALGCPVPPLLLQPLVENSLRHVIAQRPAGGKVEIRATREAERLLLRVIDDGPGFDPATARLGVGITNTIERLEQLYRGAAHIDFAHRDNAFVITIDIPVEDAP
ncbi:MAG TPA: histidine kinase [Thermoanaerobaculia bacterium]|nr:histidine kinase [Thermoanaerobaculia bacterium]